MSTVDPAPESRDPSPRKATLGQVLGAVLWSFFGVRKGDAMARDTLSIRPWQVILAGVAFAVLLVFALVGLVRLIMSSAS
jgi:hypothetical protein